MTVNCLKPSGYRNELYKEVSGQKCDVSLYALGHAPWLVLLFVCFGYGQCITMNRGIVVKFRIHHPCEKGLMFIHSLLAGQI